jgi:hypothetical protein
MVDMNLTKRADKDALAPVRARWSTKFLTGVAALAAVLTCFDGPLPAMITRTNRVHAHPVAQETEPAPKSKARTPAKPSAKAGKPPAQARKPAAPAAKAKAHGKKQKQVPEEVDDSITMKRAAHGREPLKGKNTGREVAIARNRAPLPMPDPEPSRKTHVVAVAAHVSKPAVAAKSLASKPAPSDAPRTLAASDDFLAAAAGKAAEAAPNKEALAQGVSHPDEMDDEQPLTPVVAKPAKPATHAPVAQVSAAPPADATSSIPRIAGFGAEGAPLETHRTLAGTMAEHRAELAAAAKAGPLPAAEQAEITDEAVKPLIVPAIYTRGGRILMPAPLKGSHDVLVHQNLMADNEGLERIQDDETLNSMLASHQLARLPESASLHVNEDLPENRRYARPWTVHFAVDLAKAYQQHFGEPLQVNSAVRTVSYQLRLMRVNGNAAAVEGETASPHLTGQAIDFAKRNMSKAELAWMRAALLPLMQAGKIDVEEEFQQACFHISVYRSYMPAAKKKVKTELAAVKRDEVEDAR